MARKTLASQALKKKNTLLNTANQSEKFQKEITDETNVAELPEDVKEKILYLDDDMLEDDPFNQEIYGGELEVNLLAESMKTYGFLGIIIAYPHGSKYRIESGHRRRNAARIAEISKYPVLITEPPKTEWERKMRLFLGNLHGRKEKPMILARTAQGLYETHKMEIKHKRENNLLEEGEITALNELVAIDMEIDIKSVEKYKMLLKLIPELQEMADSGDYSWSALTTAATLEEQQQKKLEAMIREKTEAEGAANVTRTWIVDISNRLKLEQSLEDVKKAQDDASKKQNTRIRRKNGTKVIMNCAKNLHEVLDKDSLIKEEEITAVIETLEGLKSSIEMKINALREHE